MHETTPTAQALRALLPELALRTDKAEMLRQIRPLQLDIDPQDPDFRICIRLLNGYFVTLTAGDMSLRFHDSWVRLLPVHKLLSHDFHTLIAQEITDQVRMSIKEVPVYTAFVRLMHDDERVQVPTTHHFVESPNVVALIDDALTWCRASTGLPLQWKHLDKRARA